MKKLNILDLHRNITMKKQKRIECFEKVVELCHKKIVSSSDNKKTRIFYEVPEFILGYPLYDINDCIRHVMDALQSNGFIVTYYFPRYLYVSWDLDEIEEHKAMSKKNKNGMQKKGPAALDFKCKPSGKLTLDL
jgi:hypothetical protein